MNKKLLSYLIVMALAVLGISSFSTVTQAQDTAKKLAYGDSIKGEITNTAFEVDYKFSGDKGDIIIIKT